MPEIKNPNQGGGSGSQDSRSFLLMIVVMFGVIFGLQYFRSRQAPDTIQQQQQPSALQNVPATGTPAAPVATSSAKVAVPVVQAAAETATTIENELYKITFSNRGGQVTSWILKKYKDNEGHPLDLVHNGASAKFGYPLSLYTYDAGLNNTLAQALYVPSATGDLQQPATVTFKYAAGNIQVTKTFTFGSDYVIHADAQVLRDGNPIRALIAWPTAFGDMETAQALANAQIDTATNGKDQHDAFKKVIGGATLSGPFDFAGVTDQYFAAVFMPDTPADATVATFSNQLDFKEVVHHQPWYKGGNTTTLSTTEAGLPSGNKAPDGSVRLPQIGIAAGDLSGTDHLRIFVGPKALPVLESVKTANGHNLGPVLDFGFWGYVSKFLYYGLHFTQEHLAPTWGWAIVVFTLLINLLLLPLRVQGMHSALKMKRIQPQIDLIKAKYKNPGPTDPRAAEMNAEVMAYQKSQGVSMFGGCIPSLVQLPLLIAFFTMMNRVIELRQAHFLWLHDLSQPDPYHILPIVMGLTSFLAQYYTPSPGVDPQQQKMMAFMMPSVSVFMTWNYASALGLYWNVGNIVMIIQTQLMNQTKLGREIRETELARARKIASGSGASGKPPVKTIQAKR